MKSAMFIFSFVVYVLMNVYDASLDIVTGGDHNCVFEPGQTGMVCWGENNYGQLGYGDTNNRGDTAGEMGANLTIVNLGPDFVVNATSLGRYHSCATSQEKEVKCWGYGEDYQLGYATNDNLGDGASEMGDNLTYVVFRDIFIPLKVAAGGWHSCVLSTNSLLVCFGRNWYGQCGADSADEQIVGPPANMTVVDLGSNFTPIDISAFYIHMCALSQQQTVKCFGYNGDGQLGYGDTVDRGTTPQSMGDALPEIDLGQNFTPKAVVAGYSHTCALSTIKTVKCFGDNGYGQCGQALGTTKIGDAANEMGDNLPIINFPAGFVPMQMALGYKHTCILSESAQVLCFGQNQYGELGLGHTLSTSAMGFNMTPVEFGAGFVPRKITAGNWHTCAISTVNTVKCFGYNVDGELGLEHTNNVGDGPNEMGDDLPSVEIDFTASPTKAPTKAPTATPTTATPTTATATPTTATPTTATVTANPTAPIRPNTQVMFILTFVIFIFI